MHRRLTIMDAGDGSPLLSPSVHGRGLLVRQRRLFDKFGQRQPLHRGDFSKTFNKLYSASPLWSTTQNDDWHVQHWGLLKYRTKWTTEYFQSNCLKIAFKMLRNCQQALLSSFNLLKSLFEIACFSTTENVQLKLAFKNWLLKPPQLRFKYLMSFSAPACFGLVVFQLRSGF